MSDTIDNMKHSSIGGNQRFYNNLLLVFGIMGLALFFLLFFPRHIHIVILIVALTLMYQGAIWLRFYRSLNHWQKVDAVITALDEQWISSELASDYSRKYRLPTIEYEYQLNEATHRSSRVSHEPENIWVPEVDSWGIETKAADKFWANWQVGSSIAVYIDPANHNRSVIINRLSKQRKSHHLALFIGGLILLFVWALLLAAM